MKGFPWRFAVYFVLAIYLFADLYACRGPLHRVITGRGEIEGPQAGDAATAARVYGRPITLLELREAMRDHLWRRGEDWGRLGAEARKQTRWLVLETLVNDRMIHAFRVMNGLDAPPLAGVADEELSTLQRQFERDDEFQARLALQHLTERDLAERVRLAGEDQAWIEQVIARRIEEVTEVDARQWFEHNKGALTIPSSYRAAHIYLTIHDAKKPAREPEIREIHRKLICAEGTFEMLAGLHSEDERTKNIGGDLGWFTRDRMPEDFMAAVEKLEPGTPSDPILTKLGWHVILLKEKKPARSPSFEEVGAEILAMLRNRRREDAVRSLIGELRERSMKPTQFIFYHAETVNRAEPADWTGG